MAKKVVAPKTKRVNKHEAALTAYKAEAINYFNSVRTRTSVEHSSTPSSMTRDGKTGPTSLLVTELTTIVRTASKLDKLVVLAINGDNLVVLLEDKVPQPPWCLY